MASSLELRAQLDQLAEVDWRHPSWWALVASIVALERLSSPRGADAAYITSNGGPRSDTFMAQALSWSGLAASVLRAVARARAAARALLELDGRHPQQPLICQLDLRRAIAHRRPADPWKVLFATPTGVFCAQLDARGVDDGALALELALACVSAPVEPRLLAAVDPMGTELLGACIGVSLFREQVSTARHLHRRTWNRSGGPWLGLGQTAELELVTTSHTVVDGYAHAEISQRIFEAAAGVQSSLSAAAVARVVAGASLVAAPVQGQARTLGIGTAVVEPTRFAELTYATALALERYYRRGWTTAQRRAARFTPSLQIPVAPGRRDEADRYRRRVVPGLLALRMADGVVEPFEIFRSRLPALIEREAMRAGILTRIRTAVAQAPVPRGWVRRWLAGGAEPNPWLPPIAVLAGRGCVSYMRLERVPKLPVFAASAPALEPTAGDDRGSNVLTAVDTAAGLALTVSGTGLAGTAAGAGEFAVLLRQALDSTRTSQAARRRREPG